MSTDQEKLIIDARRRYGDEVFKYLVLPENEIECDLERLSPDGLAKVVALAETLHRVRVQAVASGSSEDLAIQFMQPAERSRLLVPFLQVPIPVGEALDTATLLVVAATNVYPELLLEMGGRRSSQGAFLPSGMMHLDWTTTARLGVMLAESPEIKPHLSGDAPDIGMGQLNVSSPFSASSVQPVILVGKILESAFLRMRLSGPCSISAFRHQVLSVLQRTLDEAAGRAAPQMLHVYRGVALCGDQSLVAGDVELLPWRPSMNGIAPSDTAPSTMDGRTLGFVVVTELTANLVIDSVRDLETDLDGVFEQPAFVEAREKLERISQDLNLAAFLALESERAVGVQMSYSTSISPWLMGSAGLSPDYAMSDSVVLDEERSTELQLWLKRVQSAKVGDARIGLQRLGKAVLHRRDPEDVIIDGVIAWENLFGDSKAELGFRISTSMAYLLSSEPEERLELQGQINKLYGLRSEIVHGAKPKKDLDVSAREVLALSRRILRVLYKDHPDYLDERKGAAALLLGG